MWELIRTNKRKSWLLLSAMALCLGGLGYFIGAFVEPIRGGFFGVLVALAVWTVLSTVGYFAGDSILLAISNAKRVTPAIHPQLFNVVEEMKLASALPWMPKIYIIDEAHPNAFATGRSPDRSSLAVTAGLLAVLDRDELQGVVAHEMSHILNRDILFMTLAGVLLGSVSLLSEFFLRGLHDSAVGVRRYRSKGSLTGPGPAQVLITVGALAFAVLGPILVRIFYFALSRRREYLADATAVRLTRYPEGLASALGKLDSRKYATLFAANEVTAPMYLVNPLEGESMKLLNLMATHPPTHERIKILRSMMHGANYSDYERAYEKVRATTAVLLPASALRDTQQVPIREGTARIPAPPVQKKTMAREMGDLMRALNDYAFLVCSCGLRIKIPPDFKEKSFRCPRCNQWVENLTADLTDLASLTAAVGTGRKGSEVVAEAPKEREYIRKGKMWETFSCSCGGRVQLAPNFCGSLVECRRCGAITKVRVPEDLRV